MRKRWLVFGVLLIYLIGCSTNSSVSNTNNNGNHVPGGGESETRADFAYNATNTPHGNTTSFSGSNTQNEVGSSEIVTDSSINIPSYNEAAPSGLLQQLAWAPIGGGEPKKPPCGDCSIELSETSMSMRAFAPFQELGVGIYRNTAVNECGNSTADFVISVDVQVDDNGNFDFTLNGKTDDLFIGFVTDAHTHNIIWQALYNTYSFSECPIVNNPAEGCPGAPPQRLKVDKMAYVCTMKDTVKLRSGPGKSYETLKSLVPGADIEIVGGPKCADNWSWWQVKTESGYSGWMTEGGDSTDKYYLCPK